MLLGGILLTSCAGSDSAFLPMFLVSLFVLGMGALGRRDAWHLQPAAVLGAHAIPTVGLRPCSSPVCVRCSALGCGLSKCTALHIYATLHRVCPAIRCLIAFRRWRRVPGRLQLGGRAGRGQQGDAAAARRNRGAHVQPAGLGCAPRRHRVLPPACVLPLPSLRYMLVGGVGNHQAAVTAASQLQTQSLP